jgi:hypothetical protein
MPTGPIAVDECTGVHPDAKKAKADYGNGISTLITIKNMSSSAGLKLAAPPDTTTGYGCFESAFPPTVIPPGKAVGIFHRHPNCTMTGSSAGISYQPVGRDGKPTSGNFMNIAWDTPYSGGNCAYCKVEKRSDSTTVLKEALKGHDKMAVASKDNIICSVNVGQQSSAEIVIEVKADSLLW